MAAPPPPLLVTSTLSAAAAPNHPAAIAAAPASMIQIGEAELDSFHSGSDEDGDAETCGGSWAVLPAEVPDVEASPFGNIGAAFLRDDAEEIAAAYARSAACDALRKPKGAAGGEVSPLVGPERAAASAAAGVVSPSPDQPAGGELPPEFKTAEARREAPEERQLRKNGGK